ncbi:hypothetical protein SAMN05444156_1181 [Verrucomicrobium sp. GAS474]|uniref:hypothetical protein n=1 Tax=Verrucomicrobium sp. GAS474 TaxID=1882831 RepID=UPI00087CC75C|nr:hypothetical protein [Verrucomicrobium sp. GAS474]SDT97400.1 hypothetical protein SAMN05444156_1181 [Verrucomicrobium sp. GAS474]
MKFPSFRSFAFLASACSLPLTGSALYAAEASHRPGGGGLPDGRAKGRLGKSSTHSLMVDGTGISHE